MSLGQIGRTAFGQLGKRGWRTFQPRQFRTSLMSAPRDTHPAKKLKTTETKKVTRPSLPSVVAASTDFRVFLRSSVPTTVPSTAMKPWLCTCSGKRRPTPMQVCHVDSLLHFPPLTPLLGRIDPNERPGNVGHLRYSGGCRGRV